MVIKRVFLEDIGYQEREREREREREGKREREGEIERPAFLYNSLLQNIN